MQKEEQNAHLFALILDFGHGESLIGLENACKRYLAVIVGGIHTTSKGEIGCVSACTEMG